MLEVILEGIVFFFVEILFQGLIMQLFKAIKLVGLLALKMITLSDEPIKELKEKYKDSNKPYYIGFGIAIGVIYLIIRSIN